MQGHVRSVDRQAHLRRDQQVHSFLQNGITVNEQTNLNPTTKMVKRID